MPRGRKQGAYTPGTFGGWLATAKPGAVWWSERDSRNLAGDAGKAGRNVMTTTFYAVAPKGRSDVQAVKLTRVEILEENHA